ncbi:MAG: hypothetical protein J6T25_02305 [Bacilli bacterium]|nr:hypothetical protein [Bacilli bacterium]
MEKKPLVMVAKDAKDAASKLNEYVEKGAYEFDFGISQEYSITVTKRSDGSKSEVKEKRYRFTGMMNMYVGDELDSLNAVKGDLENAKKERAEMNRTLNIMNKSAFAPISILLLGIAIFTLVFGILTLAGVLPLPKSQIGIAIALVVVGTLALAGSIVLAVFRSKKKKMLLEKKDEILKQDQDLQAKEKEIDNRVPEWYKDALWTVEGNAIKNALQRHELK